MGSVSAGMSRPSAAGICSVPFADGTLDPGRWTTFENVASSFGPRQPGLDRVYSIDNGRSLDGVSYYSGEADWDAIGELVPDAAAAGASCEPATSASHSVSSSSWARPALIAC